MQETKINLKIKLGEEIRRISLNEKSFIGLQKQIKEIFGLKEGSFTFKYKDEEGDLVTISCDEELIESFQSIKGNLLRIEIIPNAEEKEGKCGRFRRWRGKCGEWKKKEENNQFPHSSFHHSQPFHRDRENPFHRIPFHFGGFFPHHHISSQEREREFPLFDKLKEIASNLFGNEFEEEKERNEEGEGEGSFLENLLKSGLFEIEQNYNCDECHKGIRGDRFHCTECADFDFCSACFETKLSSHPQHKFEKFTGLEELQKALKNGQQIDSFFEQKQSVNSPSVQKQDQSPIEMKQEEIIQEIQVPVEEQKQEIKQAVEQPNIEQNIQKEDVQQEPEKETKVYTSKDTVEEKKVIYPFEQKLEDLFTMGFNDRKKNILALVQNKGDIQLAIEYL
eukprot:TRINITY_DN3732_c0_g1_i2.p1 TRINITY_DN3732_c0_g1~~TRINITY_DN3732_c0_g1_i2.p1  ORF type:complete len:393 (+),score=173.19 TRINITY_DN3732_c0_g1_i2:55-1233(+)